ncbi:MAG: DUF5615 family PIN-like protein [Planctomycetota bacterium]
MRFLGDIPIGRVTLTHLTSLGHDAIHVSARLPPTAKDSEIIHLAATEQRIVLCFDLGMAELVALSGLKLPTVITFRTTRRKAEHINRHMDILLAELGDELLTGLLVTVEDLRLRVRPLPIISMPRRRNRPAHRPPAGALIFVVMVAITSNGDRAIPQPHDRTSD